MGSSSGRGEGFIRKVGPVEANSEEDIFKALGLQYVPPSLREGMGEVEAAERNELPELLEFSDLEGCFHNHYRIRWPQYLGGSGGGGGPERVGIPRIADHSESELSGKRIG